MVVPTSEREEACKAYFLRARKKNVGLKSGLDRQFFADGLVDVWKSFDALLALRFASGNSNRGRRDIFCSRYGRDFPTWKMSDQFREATRMLMKLSPVTNMEDGRKFSVSNPSDLQSILDFSYAVRGNLGHGAKDMESDTDAGRRNRELVEFSFKATIEILEHAMKNEGI